MDQEQKVLRFLLLFCAIVLRLLSSKMDTLRFGVDVRLPMLPVRQGKRRGTMDAWTQIPSLTFYG